MVERALLIIFAKAPVPGDVNTRLIPHIGIDAATRLQAELIQLRMQQFAAMTEIDVELWCAPDTTHALFQQCNQHYGVTLRTQQGNDLGERMAHAFAHGCANHPAVVLIGTDAPAVDEQMLRAVIDALRSHEVVVVPAEDGGYVLIAMHQYIEQVFQAVAWGTSEVLAQTRASLEALELGYVVLQSSWDIDRPEDYQRYLREFRCN
jgi:rSAM/selenodomain-associated transferase 1